MKFRMDIPPVLRLHWSVVVDALNCILVRMVPSFSNPVGNVVDCDDAVEQHDRDEVENAQGKVVEMMVFHGHSHLAKAELRVPVWLLNDEVPSRHSILDSTSECALR